MSLGHFIKKFFSEKSYHYKDDIEEYEEQKVNRTSPVFLILKRLRLPLILLISIYAILILGFTLIPGKDDTGQIWYMSFFHAFYFVSYMGSTIGFGEIPYAFTEAQRMWTIIGIYSSVIAWIYSIGQLINILKESGFQKVLTENSFERKVKRLQGPFYLVCGYGDTGKLITHGLSDLHLQAVVIDNTQSRIEALQIDEQDMNIPCLCANALYPENLILAGLKLNNCMGVLALTHEDQVNLKISITAKLLNKDIIVISRADTVEFMANLKSFDTDYIINPYQMFAKRLSLAIRSPGAYMVYDWFTNSKHDLFKEPPSPPKGKWLICGYGRFGKAVERYLRFEGIRTTIIEAQPETTHAPDGFVKGSGTESVTLKEGGIHHTEGVVAGTDNDSNNLSIIMTAKQIKRGQKLFCVARQNFHRNTPVFKAAELDLVMQPATIVAREIMAIIKTPLLAEFLSLVNRQKSTWINPLISSILGLFDKQIPHTWAIQKHDFTDDQVRNLISEEGITLKDLIRDPHNRDSQLCCLPLMLKYRKQDKKSRCILLPDLNKKIYLGDEILFCGDLVSMNLMHLSLDHFYTMQYIKNSIPYEIGWFLKSFSRQQTSNQ